MLATRGFKIFARLDQVKEARAVGLPMVILIFGDPKAGIPFVIEHPFTVVDLPLKAVVWESADGKVWLTYSTPEYLQQRHNLPAPPFVAAASLIESVACLSDGCLRDAQSTFVSNR